MLPKFLTSILCAATISFGFAMPVQADPNWDAAKTGFEICLNTFPEGSRANAAFKAAGWRYEGVEAGMHIFTRNGFRSVAATNAGKSSTPRCFVSASKMPVSFANEILKIGLKSLKNAKQTANSSSGVVARWEGTANGTKTVLGVLDQIDFGVMRGAAVGFLGQ